MKKKKKKTSCIPPSYSPHLEHKKRGKKNPFHPGSTENHRNFSSHIPGLVLLGMLRATGPRCTFLQHPYGTQGIGRGLGTLQHELIHPCLLLPHARGPAAPTAGTQAPQLPKNLEAPALVRLWSCPGGTSGASQVCFQCLFQGSFSKCSQIRTLRLACEVFCPRGKAGQEDRGLSRLAKLPHSPESYYQPQISL